MVSHHKNTRVSFKKSRKRNIILLLSLLSILVITFGIINIGNNFVGDNPTNIINNEKDNNEWKDIEASNPAEAVNVCITEVGYDGNYDWIEIYNPGSEVNLSEWSIVDGDNSSQEVDLSIVGNLTHGEVVTLGHGSADVVVDYEIGSFYQDFDDQGDDIILRDNYGNFQDVVIYGGMIGNDIEITHPAWYWDSSDTINAPEDTTGTIQRINRTIRGELEDNNLPSDWELIDSPTNGTLPQFNPLTPEVGSIIISEVMYGGDGNEWIELYNNESEDVHIGGCSMYSYTMDNKTSIPIGEIIGAKETYIIGEHPTIEIDLPRNISLNDNGDVLVLNSSEGVNLDVLVWGNGNSTFSKEGGAGWSGNSNATGSLPENQSIFRYRITQDILSDTNKSIDWYNTSEPTPGAFYEVQVGDVLISEVYTDSAGPNEFIEIYNNLTWPITLDGMVVWDYETEKEEVEFIGNVTINPKNVLTAGDGGEYYDNTGFTSKEDLVLYRDSGRSYELDVVVIGDYPDTNYPWGPNSGWIGPTNVTDPDSGKSVQRINGSDYNLIDTNSSSDWESGDPTPGTIPAYIAPPPPNIIISEVMYGGEGNEWIEIMNNGSESVDINNFKLYSYQDDNETVIDTSISIAPYETYVVGEDTPNVDLEKNISLIDSGDVLILKNTENEIMDTVVWGTGDATFDEEGGVGWIGTMNATGDLSAGHSIFRYNLTKTILSDTNTSNDWYTTSEPTLGGFYEIKVGDVLISEIYNDGGTEFIEIFNNLTWPVTLDGMEVWDYSGEDVEISFVGNITVSPKNVITAGKGMNVDYNASDTSNIPYPPNDFVLYRGPGQLYELDVVIVADPSDDYLNYPWGESSGWIGPNNVSDPDSGESVQRINGSNYELLDTNTSSDWKALEITPGYIPPYVPPPETGNASSVLITELIVDAPGTDNNNCKEYIELYNTLDTPINIGNWSLWHSDEWDDEPMVQLDLGTEIPAKTHYIIGNNITMCIDYFNITGLYYPKDTGLTVTNSPDDVILADTNKNIIDRIAYKTTSTNYFENPIPSDPSWKKGDEGILDHHVNFTLTRTYDKYTHEYIDTNSSADWRTDIYPSPGKHSNQSLFLNTPFTVDATITAFSSPDNSFAAFSDLIGNATSSIDLSVYQFTSAWILDELIDAMNRGVEVRALLEDSFVGGSVDGGGTEVANEMAYIATAINNHTNGIVRWEDHGWRIFHNKYFIVDEEVIVISTENYKQTGIPYDTSAGNRGWGIAVNNSQIAQEYLKVFNLDWEYGSPFGSKDLVESIRNDDVLYGSYEPPLGPNNYSTTSISNAQIQTIISPDETIDVMTGLIDSAQESVYCEIFYIYPTWDDYPGSSNNNPLLLSLVHAAERGLDVKVILDSTDYNIYGDNNNDEAFQILKTAGVNVTYSKNVNGIEKFHVKALMVDNESVMISSVNWNEYSTTENREMGIIVNASSVANYYLTIFNHDWKYYSTAELAEEPGQEQHIPLGLATYFWIYWLPIASVLFGAILITGYVVRAQKEKKQKQEELKRSKVPKMKPDKELQIDSVPVEVENIRQKISQYYGEEVRVSHLNSNGEPYDEITPSDFVSKYIEINDDLIPVGDFSRPISRVLLLKYDQNNYVAIEGKLKLQLKLFDKSLKRKIGELSSEIERLKSDQKTPLDELVNELQQKIIQQKVELSKLKEKQE